MAQRGGPGEGDGPGETRDLPQHGRIWSRISRTVKSAAASRLSAAP